MKMLVAAWLATLASAGLTQGEPRPAAPGADAPYTSGRLTPEQMRALVAEPLDLLQSGDIAGAERALAAQLSRVPQAGAGAGADEGDLLMSFGVSLFHTAEAQDEHLLGIAYMRRALDAYTAAFGRNHPEVGLTLSDIGHALLVIEPDDPSAEAEEAIEAAWRVRTVALGTGNVETASSLGTLAGLRGRPSRTRGDRARIAASAQLFEQAIRNFGTRRVVPGQFGSITTRFDLAGMYLLNRLPREALAAALDAQADYRANFAGDGAMCNVLISRSLAFATELARSGHQPEGDELRAALREGIPCHRDDSLIMQDLERLRKGAKRR